MKKHQDSHIFANSVQSPAWWIKSKLHTLVLVCTILIVSGCTTLSNTPLILNSPSELQEWQARGKVLLRNNGEKVSGYFFWHRNNDNFTLSLNSFIGTNVLTLTFQDGLATLQVDGKTYKANDPERLIYNVTGNKIPVLQMSDWMLANIDTDSKFIRKILYNSNSIANNPALTNKSSADIKSFIYNNEQKQDWQITYNNYQQHDSLYLPNKLNVETAKHKIKLTINNWEFIR